jgi:hypothetical protein
VEFRGDDFGRNAAALIEMTGRDDDLTRTKGNTIATPFASLGVDDYIQNLVPFD